MPASASLASVLLNVELLPRFPPCLYPSRPSFLTLQIAHLKGSAKAKLSNMEMGDKAVDVGSPDVVKDRLGVLLGEPETMPHGQRPFSQWGYLGLHYDLATTSSPAQSPSFDTKTLRVFGIDLNQGSGSSREDKGFLFALRMEVAVSPCAPVVRNKMGTLPLSSGVEMGLYCGSS